MALRYIAPALAVAGSAAASCSGTTTISNSADAMALSTCATYSGDIAIATGTTDDIALDGIRRISGSLMAKNVPNMATLSADSMTQIDDTFSLNNIQTLSTLNFPMLQSVDTVDWVALPGLSGLSFTTGLSKVQTLSIDNTNLGSLSGIELMSVGELSLANNVYLNDISMPLTYVSQGLYIHDNGDQTNANFPNLQWAANLTINNCYSVNVDSLSVVNGSMGYYSNYFSSFSAPNLTLIGITGGGLAFVDNPKLTNISMDGLKAIGGGLTIANNTDLTQVTGFSRVTEIKGAVSMLGYFKNVQFPSITDVRGTFTLLSKNDISSDCSHFQSLHTGRASTIKGAVKCQGSQAHVPGTGSSNGGSSGTSGSGSSSSSSGAANAVYISGATGVLGVVAAMFGML